ncbi:copper resistance CopC/CopD family protein [Lysinibacillus antri]|uniref:Copper resistance protein CopC n=1 Tax=Lysinibacillus antri TaxID=2498145 RepID=A0A432LG09_9BACI|nr:copper resistance protein CopC [Lysinibacillus antri]RUL55582.1 hypothetical protein EK386_04460 [Lysinibacillus antri]
MRAFKIPITILFMTLFFAAFGHSVVWGHSFVTEESPAKNSTQESSPTEIQLIFNSKVEKDFSLKLLDENQQEIQYVTKNIDSEQKQISIQIPPLPSSKYTVEYYVISSNDGHPIRGSYQFQVKVKEEPVPPNTHSEQEMIPKPYVPPIDKIEVPQTQPQPEPINNYPQASEWIIYFMKALYFFGLVLVIGWVLLFRLVIHKYPKAIKEPFLFWGTILQMVHLVGLISVILIQFNIFSLNGLSFTFDSPFETIFTALWIISLFMALLGFIFLFKSIWFDVVWVLIIVLSKSLNGHAFEFEPKYVLVITDSIHLLAASLWASGLTLLIILWRKETLYVNEFLPIFSKMAFYSIGVLSITGTSITVIYAPSINLLLTTWGILLLIKILLVCLVIGMGFIIRRKMKKMNIADLSKWIVVDFTLMLLILIIVSIFTYLNPLQ